MERGYRHPFLFVEASSCPFYRNPDPDDAMVIADACVFAAFDQAAGATQNYFTGSLDSFFDGVKNCSVPVSVSAAVERDRGQTWSNRQERWLLLFSSIGISCRSTRELGVFFGVFVLLVVTNKEKDEIVIRY